MAKMIQCPKCGKPYYSTLKMCPECGMPRPKNTKRTVTIVLACVAAFLIIGVISGLVNENKPVTEIETGGIPSSSETLEQKNSKYDTYGEWAALSNYMFAVEIDDFNGDVFQVGNYRFYVEGKAHKEQDVFIVWDIYVSDNCYSNMRDLKKSEYVASVGGNSKVECNVSLKKGQYVYIKYNETVGNPSGILCIEKQKD